MFGYIKPKTCDLRVRDYEVYKAAYCGLCRDMGKCVSRFSRLALSYDMVFAVLLRNAAAALPVSLGRHRCGFKCRSRAALEASDTYVPCISALLIYYKYADDRMDCHGLRRLGLGLLYPYFGSLHSRAAEKYPEADALIAEGMKRIAEIERSESSTADMAASAFAEMMSSLLSAGMDGIPREICAGAGYNAGMWVYYTDALDDLAEDYKRGEFNPYLRQFGSPEGVFDHLDTIILYLDRYAMNVAASSALTEYGQFRDILINIAESGMPAVHNAAAEGFRAKYIKMKKETANGSV